MGCELKYMEVKKTFLTVCLIVLLAVLSGVSNGAESSKILDVTISPDTRYQTIDGFGASDAWRVQFVGEHWPLEKRNRMADLLFSREFDPDGNPKGIGLSLWRFYLSSGTAQQADDSGIRNPWRRGDCFLNADGSCDWSRHAGQRWFLQAAQKRGVEKFLAFTNAAPVYLSNNGKGYATKGDLRLNIKPGRLKDYARYMADVLEHFSGDGLVFDYLSPVNEPQWNWDKADQEGTPAQNEEIYKLVRHLSKALSERGLTTRIVIGEAGTIGHAAMPMESMSPGSDGRDDQTRFFFSEQSPFYIGDLPNVEKTMSAHSYFSVWPIEKQVEYRTTVNELLKQANPDLGYWMSEYCILQENDEIGGGSGRDLTMKTALYVARIIHHDLTLTHAKSWQWWTALSQCDYKDGLIYLDDGSRGDTGKTGSHVESLRVDGTIRDSKLLWVLGNYSRFIRPGMVRIGCSMAPQQSAKDGVLASAYADPENKTVVYVFTNLSNQPVHIRAGAGKRVKIYTTDAKNNLGLSFQSLDNLLIPERSVVTVIHDR